MKGFKACFTFIIIFTILTLGLTGCGSSDKDDNPVTTTISGVASKGLINGGTVQVFALDANGNKGNALGSQVVTDANGAYSVQIGSYTGNVLVEITGGTYTDEATGATIPAPTLQAAMTGAQGSVSVSVTPLTDIAVKCAGNALTKQKIEEANYLVGTAFGVVDIVGTMPHDINGSTDKFDEANYGLMLAAMSQMSQTQNLSIGEIIDDIKDDLVADNKLEIQAQNIVAAYNAFAVSANNKTGIQAIPALVEDAVNHAGNNPIVIPDSGNLADLTKAKGMVADLRNTMLSLYDYQGIGVEGIVETPFNTLSEDMMTNVGPNLTSIVDRITWIVDSMNYIPDNEPSPYTFILGNLELEVTVTEGSNMAGLASASFTVQDTSQDPAVTLDTGSVTLTSNALGYITSGTFTASMSAPGDEELTADLNFTGTYSAGTLASVTLTGSLSVPGGISYDFSQQGRRLHATFAHNPAGAPLSENALIACYPTQVSYSGRITTPTAQMDGTLDVSDIVWNPPVTGSEDCDDPSFLPKSALFEGIFQELKNGSATGARFSGKITANWTNAATYKRCFGESSTNFPIWDAAFDGSINAPQRPTIVTHLGVSQTAYHTFALSLSYRRTDADGKAVYLSGSGSYDDETYQMQASLSNQNQLALTISYDGTSLDRNERFTGAIKASNGTSLAELYTTNGMPYVKYTDDYIESII